MTLNAAVAVVVATGLVINLRFLLYSAAMAPLLQNSGPLLKVLCAFTLTDQSYATMTANESKFSSNREAVEFYLGTAACMLLVWHASVTAGFVFGNFAPARWSLDYAVPLSFVALLIPVLKDRRYVAVALTSSVLSLFLHHLPLKTGLVATALLSMLLAAWFLRKKA
jgi:predicted branched-subunit amino acid permease